ncbi:magnesium transporter CorA family protein [Paenibacillus swuensis]|nr:hypothetical protein [Paenibacillus swuensis]
MKQEVTEKKLRTGLGQFIFPFSIEPNKRESMISQLVSDGYEPFYLNKMELEKKYYGSEFNVSHQRMERYFLPFTSNVLFPHEDDPDAMQRFSKKLDLECELNTPFHAIPFRILSIDVMLCPFDLGFITIRTELAGESIVLSTALEFASRLRVLQDVTDQDCQTSIQHDGVDYEEVEKFIFQKLASGILPFLDKSGMEGAYFETLPYFMDERMYCIFFYGLEEGEQYIQNDLYRVARLDGYDMDGKPFISSSNPDYIQRYCEIHSYNRWAPDTNYIVNEHTFACITNQTEGRMRHLANQMFGEYYYGLLLNMFHKIVLLKLSNCYSHVRMARDNDAIEDLIRNITKFSSKYFFLELVSQSQGREIFIMMRRIFNNNELYQDVKQTLMDLFKYQERFASRNQNYLLMILTLYTVVGGIYGMNQVIEDLKGDIDWGKMGGYSVFEYIALFITFSGLLVGFLLGAHVIRRYVKEQIKKNKQ